jgi:hypothetical protein
MRVFDGNGFTMASLAVFVGTSNMARNNRSMKPARTLQRQGWQIESARPLSAEPPRRCHTALMARLEPQGRDVRRSIRSKRSFMGSGPQIIPELEISSRSSRTDWGRHAGRPDPFGSPYFAKLVQ